MPCPFTGRKMFCAGPNVLSQPKNLTAFSASSKTFVPAQKTNLMNRNHHLVWHKMYINFWTGTKHFGTRSEKDETKGSMRK